jgi:murein DD-endopeptidase MepM/ murein hydrolase activator NlpD
MRVWKNKETTMASKRKSLFTLSQWRVTTGPLITMKALKLGLLILPSLIAGFMLGYLTASQPVSETFQKETTAPAGDNREETHVASEAESKIETVAYTFKQGDTFYEALLNLHFSPQEVFRVIESSKNIYNLKKIKPGKAITLEVTPDNHSLKRLEYDFDGQNLLVVTKTDQGYRATREAIIFDTSLRTISGTIKTNLFDDAANAGAHPQLILNLADIFAWDVDFFSDLRKGDSFKFLFEEISKDGKFVKYGKVLAAEFINQGNRFRVFRFEDPQGKSGYYNDTGKSVAREFLKSPLRYSRVSSRFSKRRFHPILRTYRPHLGVDYAAPTGTPVEATCDGKIVFIGRKKGDGKCIIVRHNHIYTSYYGHLSGFAKGMKRGKRVKQGQVIGYVGATGLATGPHLDYRLKKRGVFINPLKFKSSRVRSISEELRPQFEKHKQQLLVKLEQSDKELIMAKAHVLK